ncbi:MAG TPA: metallopeptidase TldD-related protein [Micromonosporaceae bacterium]
MTPQQIVEIALAAGVPGTTWIAIVEQVTAAHVRWAGNACTAGAIVDERRLTVVALGADGASGVASASGALDVATIRTLAAEADRLRGQRITVEAPPAPPVVADDGASWHRPPLASATVDLPGFTARLAESFRLAAAAGHLLYGYAGERTSATYLASTAGLRRWYETSSAVLDHTVRTPDGAVTWTGTYAPGLSQLDLDAAYRAAQRRLTWWRRRVDLPSGEYEVVLPPSCVADLMLHLYRAADARAAMEGRTVFSAAGGGTRIGERLSSAPLTLHSDPRQPGLECAPFAVARGSDALSVYDNGLPLARTDWIVDGVLSALISSRHTAAGTGTAGQTGPAGQTGAAAAPAIGNLILTGGDGRSLDDLVARTRRGLLLTSLWYLREVDPRTLTLTGLTRDGVYLVEDGEIRGAVNPFRFNASPLRVLARVCEVGRTEATLPREHDEHTIRMAMPALRVADFALTAVRDAG